MKEFRYGPLGRLDVVDAFSPTISETLAARERAARESDPARVRLLNEYLVRRLKRAAQNVA